MIFEGKVNSINIIERGIEVLGVTFKKRKKVECPYRKIIPNMVIRVFYSKARIMYEEKYLKDYEGNFEEFKIEFCNQLRKLNNV